jgi:hypothetical protein
LSYHKNSCGGSIGNYAGFEKNALAPERQNAKLLSGTLGRRPFERETRAPFIYFQTILQAKIKPMVAALPR